MFGGEGVRMRGILIVLAVAAASAGAPSLAATPAQERAFVTATTSPVSLTPTSQPSWVKLSPTSRPLAPGGISKRRLRSMRLPALPGSRSP